MTVSRRQRQRQRSKDGRSSTSPLNGRAGGRRTSLRPGKFTRHQKEINAMLRRGLTIGEIAKELGVARQTIYTWKDGGGS